MWEGVPRTKMSEYFSFQWMYVSFQCYQCSWKQLTFLAWLPYFRQILGLQKVSYIYSCVKAKDPGLLSSGHQWGPLPLVPWPWLIAPGHVAHTNEQGWWIRLAVADQGRCCRLKKHPLFCIIPWKTERPVQVYKYLPQMGKNTVPVRGLPLSLLVELFHEPS